MTQNSGTSAPNAEVDFSHTLFHNDLSSLPLGSLPVCASQAARVHSPFEIPVHHSNWPAEGCFRVIERGLGKYVEAVGSSPHCENRILIAGDPAWSGIRLRAVVTPLSFDGSSAAGGICGVIARYRDSDHYVALVLDRDGQVKLLQREGGQFEVLDAKPLEFCLGQSLTLTLTLTGNRAHGTAGPYTGATHVCGSVRETAGRVGYISDVPARFGPFTVECSAEESKQLDEKKSATAAARASARARFPEMRLERTVPLHGLLSGRNIRIADVNGDGKPEIIVAQSSATIARKFSMTRLTCLSVLDLDGNLVWQAGVPDTAGVNSGGIMAPPPVGAAPPVSELPFQIHDLYGDGGRVIVCVFGYDIQVRDGRTGHVLFSAATPDMQKSPAGADFKEVTSHFGAPWGDETLNMNVAAIAFCDTHGSGRRHEIIVKDDFHHLSILDALSSPPLQSIVRHRGNHGHYPWIGDVDHDGRDEILAGFSLIDDTGRNGWSLPLGGFPSAVAILDPLNRGDEALRLMVCAGGQFYMLNMRQLENPIGAADFPHALGSNAERLSIGKFRRDLQGLQVLTLGGNNAEIVQLYDASGKRLWSREFSKSGIGKPVNWTGGLEELILHAAPNGISMLDGRGDVVVERVESATYMDATAAFSANGRDAILAWDAERLSIYVPGDTLKLPAYRPVRPSPENTSYYGAMISTPPGWSGSSAK